MPSRDSSATTGQKARSGSNTTSAADARYTFDPVALEELRKTSPWKDDPKYFEKVAISPSAVMKMMTHCHSGVEKGVKKGGNPIEVMGLLLGRPDPSTPKTLVVTDAYPLPIEGFETRVIADDSDVINHMIALGESIENTRREKFMGWYHSHPFDLGPHSHCFLSQTDISTQLQWQRAEDPHGNPFLAIVVDPLRSLAKTNPELKAFRVYPPEYNCPTPNQCPDGSILHEEQARLEQWGNCWSRYYELKVEYYMSSGARNILSVLTQNFLWMRTLGSTPMYELEARTKYPERVSKAAQRIQSLEISTGGTEPLGRGRTGRGQTMSGSTAASGGLGSGTGTGTAGKGSATAGGTTGTTSGKSSSDEQEGELGKACQAVVEIASEKLLGNITQISKRELFS